MRAVDEVFAGLEPQPTTPPLTRSARARRPEAPTFETVPDDGPDAGPAWVARVRSWVPPDDIGTTTPVVSYAVQGLIQCGKVGALVAAGGTGKTTLLLTLGVAHATGRKFLGLGVRQGAFVLLSMDDPQEDLDAALGAVIRSLKLMPAELEMVAKYLRVISLQGEPGLRTFSTRVGAATMPTGLEELLVEAVGDIPDLVGVALDTFRQFCGGNSNDEEVVKLTIAGATALAAQTGAYVVIPHHTGKQNFRDGVTDMYCGSGSAAIADNCRFVLLLQTAAWSDIESKIQRTGQERGDPLVLTSTRGSLLVRPPEPLYLHRDGFELGRIAGAVLTSSQRLDEKARAVLRAVRRGAQTKNAIAVAVGGNKAAVLALVDDLLHRGLLLNGSENGSETRPKFIVSSAGARFLDDADVP